MRGTHLPLVLERQLHPLLGCQLSGGQAHAHAPRQLLRQRARRIASCAACREGRNGVRAQSWAAKLTRSFDPLPPPKPKLGNRAHLIPPTPMRPPTPTHLLTQPSLLPPPVG